MFMDYFGEELSKRDQPSRRTSVGFGGNDRAQKSKDVEKKLTEEQIMFLRRKQVDPIHSNDTSAISKQIIPLDENSHLGC